MFDWHVLMASVVVFVMVGLLVLREKELAAEKQSSKEKAVPESKRGITSVLQSVWKPVTPCPPPERGMTGAGQKPSTQAAQCCSFLGLPQVLNTWVRWRFSC